MPKTRAASRKDQSSVAAKRIKAAPTAASAQAAGPTSAMPSSGSSTIRHLLLTGRPGTGKTTLTAAIIERLQQDGHSVSGFWTGELREDGVRKGFSITALDGSTGRLSGIDVPSGPRVGKYKVDLADFERVALPALRVAPGSTAGGKPHVVVIDEIGKMELFSKRFVSMVETLVRKPNVIVFATIAQRGTGLIEELKRASNVHLATLTKGNRDAAVGTVYDMLLGALEKGELVPRELD